MARRVKGMVHLEGVTYRIVRVAAGSYAVVRISDDLDVGCFQTAPRLGIEARCVSEALLREIARLAIHSAKTSSVGFAPPERPPERAAEVAGVARRSPSSMPPPLPAGT